MTRCSILKHGPHISTYIWVLEHMNWKPVSVLPKKTEIVPESLSTTRSVGGGFQIIEKNNYFLGKKCDLFSLILLI